MGPVMADITKLTVAQAEALEDILKELRHYGFDPDGAGIQGPNMHVEAHADGGVDWWADTDEGFADGTLDPAGAGLWWLRRAQPGALHVREAR